MGWFSSFFQYGFKGKSQLQKEEETRFTMRQGKLVPVDEAHLAWISGDLNRMLNAVSIKTNPIDRHFLLQSIVSVAYKLRKEEKYRKLCMEYAEKHLHEFPTLAPAIKEDMENSALKGRLPRISTFQHYATVLTENREYGKAIAICEEALKYELHDGTKSGFDGRIARIRKKASADSNTDLNMKRNR